MEIGRTLTKKLTFICTNRIVIMFQFATWVCRRILFRNYWVENVHFWRLRGERKAILHGHQLCNQFMDVDIGPLRQTCVSNVIFKCHLHQSWSAQSTERNASPLLFFSPPTNQHFYEELIILLDREIWKKKLGKHKNREKIKTKNALSTCPKNG